MAKMLILDSDLANLFHGKNAYPGNIKTWVASNIYTEPTFENVEYLVERIVDYVGEATKNDDAISDLKSTISELEFEIQDLEDERDDLNDALDSMEEEHDEVVLQLKTRIGELEEKLNS